MEEGGTEEGQRRPETGDKGDGKNGRGRNGRGKNGRLVHEPI
ncbi:hypothetical protein [Flavihumibacter fluminis]|nr:hypothetical protein [Flavihumibacter fluminis]